MASRIPALCFLAITIGCASGTTDSDSGLGDSSVDTDPLIDSTVDDTGGCPMSCPPGETCRDGSCMEVGCDLDSPCPVGESCCDGACATLPSDPMNCGACGRTCDSRGTTCSSGQCRCGMDAACMEPEICCETGCANVEEDPMNCGGCGRVCDAGMVCEAGDCILPPCDPACAPGETCDAETRTCMCGAGAACAATEGCCGGSCIDIQEDEANCGLCGNTCGGAEVCLAATCTTDVPCDPPCAAGETCSGGVCRCGASPACGGGLSCCAGSCVDTNTSVGHCGACGRTCSGSEQCCTGLCINTQTNPDHCGGCGRDCDSDSADGCTSGSCTCAGGPACFGLCVCGGPIFGCTGFCL